MAKTKKKDRSFLEFIEEHPRDVNLVFLGVGLIMLGMNLSSFLLHVPMDYPYFWFNLSVFGSLLIVLLTTYNLTGE